MISGWWFMVLMFYCTHHERQLVEGPTSHPVIPTLDHQIMGLWPLTGSDFLCRALTRWLNRLVADDFCTINLGYHPMKYGGSSQRHTHNFGELPQNWRTLLSGSCIGTDLKSVQNFLRLMHMSILYKLALIVIFTIFWLMNEKLENRTIKE